MERKIFCAGQVHPDVLNLVADIKKEFPGVFIGEMYACRFVKGKATALSYHAFGRAVDIFPLSEAQGKNIFRWCVQNFKTYGIVEVIYQGFIFVEEREGISPYGGEDPHTDHVHISLKKLPGYGLPTLPGSL